MDLKISSTLSINADKVVTGRTCVIGQSGSGKSYTVSVLCEELAKNNIGFCIIDTEGEYFSLKEKYPLLWVGSDANSDLSIENTDLIKLANTVVEKGVAVIFDVSEVSDPKEYVGEFCSALYKIESKLKKPFLVIVEEADKFVPQTGKVVKEVEEISRRGRKRGLGLMIATQRPALVNKNILSQCNNQIIGRLTIQNDIDSVKIFFSKKKDLKALPELSPGEFFVQGDLSSSQVVKVRMRYTKHKAVTPKLVAKSAIKIEDLSVIQKEITTNIEHGVEAELEELKEMIIPPLITKEVAYDKIERRKKYYIFGPEVKISDFYLQLHPVYYCTVRYLKKKWIGTEFEDIHTYFDGLSGDVLGLKSGFKIKRELKEFMGLNSGSLRIFDKLSNSKRSLTVDELAKNTNYTESTVRESLKTLYDEGLVSSSRFGRHLYYYAMTKSKLPDIEKLAHPVIDLEERRIAANKTDFSIDLKDIREFLKALGDKVELTEYKKVYYPFYIAKVTGYKKLKKIKIDAVSGKVI